MHLKHRIVGILTAAMVIGSSISAMAADIKVKVDSLTNNVMSLVDFSVEPVQIESRTLVPVRSVCESAGLAVDWDQNSQRATVTLSADKDSAKPVEVYAYELIEAVGERCLGVTPQNIVATLKLDDTAVDVRYNCVDSDGETISIGKSISMEVPATMVNDSSLMIPLRGVMELFGLEVEWDQSTLTALISIPSQVMVPADVSVLPSHNDGMVLMDEVPAMNSQIVEEDAPAPEIVENDSRGEYIGRFKITHYCTCSKCNGGWGSATAWAGKVTPGVTIAVDPSVIPKLSWVYIEGYGVRQAQDCGGAIKGNHIDMAVSSHSEAMRLGVVYADVWFEA